jgi:methionine-rich copper-binding protein CopC
MRPLPHGRTLAILALLALTLAVPASAIAHAELVRTTPADGATVEGTPPEIVAVFSEGLDADGSSLSLRDPSGDEIATGIVDREDDTRLVVNAIPSLAPGTYQVRWTASSDDGHLERDTWSFTVVGSIPTKVLPTPSASPTSDSTATATPPTSPGPKPSATASAAPSPTPAPDGAGATGTDVLIPIIAGLAIVAVAGGFLLSRRGRR